MSMPKLNARSGSPCITERSALADARHGNAVAPHLHADAPLAAICGAYEAARSHRNAALDSRARGNASASVLDAINDWTAEVDILTEELVERLRAIGSRCVIHAHVRYVVDGAGDLVRVVLRDTRRAG